MPSTPPIPWDALTFIATVVLVYIALAERHDRRSADVQKPADAGAASSSWRARLAGVPRRRIVAGTGAFIFFALTLFLMLDRPSIQGPPGVQGPPGPQGPPGETSELRREIELALADRRLRQIEINLPKLTTQKTQLGDMFAGIEKFYKGSMWPPLPDAEHFLTIEINRTMALVKSSCPDVDFDSFREPSKRKYKDTPLPGNRKFRMRTQLPSIGQLISRERKS